MIDFSALSDDVFSQNDHLLELLAFDSVMWFSFMRDCGRGFHMSE